MNFLSEQYLQIGKKYTAIEGSEENSSRDLVVRTCNVHLVVMYKHRCNGRECFRPLIQTDPLVSPPGERKRERVREREREKERERVREGERDDVGEREIQRERERHRESER